MAKRKKIFVGLSGGVDSSVAALLLKQAGHDVVGVFIKVWHPDFLVCDWERERLDAMRVAATLDIPFLTCDAVAEYKREVADYFIESYTAGHTPNPDVLCNKHIKFGAFWHFAKTHGADAIATGHYARIEGEAGVSTLQRGVDTEKDQSYFLWMIPEEMLSRIYFPIGDLQKSAVRELAEKQQLPTAQKDESQGICFLGHVDIPEFLGHYVTLTEGAVLDASGTTIGTHRGAAAYTIGQRHGFTFFADTQNSVPHYIVSKDMVENTVTVSAERPVQHAGTIGLISPNYIGISPDTLPKQTQLSVQLRYRQKPIPAEIQTSSKDGLTLRLTTSADMPALGQSCVLYAGEQCLGGGVIDSVQ